VLPCNTAVTVTAHSTKPFYVGIQDVRNSQIHAAASAAAVPHSPPAIGTIPQPLQVPATETLTIGPTSCSDPSAPSMSCQGTYKVSAVLLYMSWSFEKHNDYPHAHLAFAVKPTSPRPPVPSTCSPYNSLAEDAFKLLFAGKELGPYDANREALLPRKPLVAGHAFTTHLAMRLGAAYSRGDGGGTVTATFSPAR
jgi:hypothetical protein